MFLWCTLLSGCLAAGPPPSTAKQESTAQVTVPAGVPLRVALDSRVKLQRAGQEVRGHLTAPVYVRDRVVLPEGAELVGEITALKSAPKLHRLASAARGDFSPERNPQIRFQQVQLSDGQTVAIETAVAQPSGQLVRMQSAGVHQSRVSLIKVMVRERKAEALRIMREPGKLDRVKTMLWMSLPYHPQWIEKGTQLDADLREPVAVPVAAHAPTDISADAGTRLPSNAVVRARLVSGLDSATDRKGHPVEAVMTEPVFDEQHRLLLPEGTALRGTVTRAKPARWFARNGQLRFTFTGMSLPGDVERKLHGQITAAEGDPKARLKVDPEGGAEAQPARNKYLAPLALATLAATAQSDEEGGGGQGFVAGGFGLMGRLMVLAVRATPVSSGFAYYSLSHSLYSRWIARGHDVVFPRDTRMEIQFGER